MNVFLVSVLILMSSLAHAGPRVIGNGGDSVSLEFVKVAQEVLYKIYYSNPQDFDLKGYEAAIQSTKIESTDRQLLLEGVPKDAINYPSEKRIIFNRKAWAQMNLELRSLMVLHEYLGIMGVNDSTYAVSSRLLHIRSFGISNILCKTDSGYGWGEIFIKHNLPEDQQALVASFSIHLKSSQGVVQYADQNQVVVKKDDLGRLIANRAMSLNLTSERGPFLVSLTPNGFENQMHGFFFVSGQTFPVSCVIRE
ncbi:hypothetical protein [Bdellovibrio sp. HCB288]|uniref:hypothetical protein n=1 Tax=Bdellovibrio sp. HCB288 TaxID=3394355 RepID=UPI0039B4C95D